jgi:hypothetical protein
MRDRSNLSHLPWAAAVVTPVGRLASVYLRINLVGFQLLTLHAIACSLDRLRKTAYWPKTVKGPQATSLRPLVTAASFQNAAALAVHARCPSGTQLLAGFEQVDGGLCEAPVITGV